MDHNVQRKFLQYADFDALASEMLGNGKSPATISSYGHTYRVYKEWCRVSGVPPLAADTEDIRRFLSHLEPEFSAKSLNPKRSALLSLFRFLQKQGLRSDNPVAEIPTYDTNRTHDRDYLRRDELEALVAASSANASDQAVVVLSVVNGLRDTDLHALTIEDLHKDGDQWHLRLTARDPVSVTPLPPVSLEVVRAAIGDRKGGPLLLNRAGNAVTRINNARTLRRVAARAGLDREVSQSVLVNGMMKLAYERGARAESIAEAVGRRDVGSVLSVVGKPSGRHPAHIVADALSGSEGQGGILDSADEFLRDVAVESAIPVVVSGVALEIHLRELCQSHDLEVAARKRGIGAYAEALKTHGTLPKEVWRQVTVWEDLRNKAAHGELDSLDSETAEEMVRGVRRFLARYPAG
jgi:integrase/recombinase XerD